MVANRIFLVAVLSIACSASALAAGTCKSVKTQATESLSRCSVLSAVIKARQAGNGSKSKTAKAFNLESATLSQLTTLFDAEKTKINQLELEAQQLAVSADSTQLAACLEVVEGVSEFNR